MGIPLTFWLTLRHLRPRLDTSEVKRMLGSIFVIFRVFYEPIARAGRLARGLVDRMLGFLQGANSGRQTDATVDRAWQAVGEKKA